MLLITANEPSAAQAAASFRPTLLARWDPSWAGPWRCRCPWWWQGAGPTRWVGCRSWPPPAPGCARSAGRWPPALTPGPAVQSTSSLGFPLTWEELKFGTLHISQALVGVLRGQVCFETTKLNQAVGEFALRQFPGQGAAKRSVYLD